MGTVGYYRAAGYYGYCVVPTGTAVVPTGTTGTTVLRVLRYYKRVLYSTHGYYVVHQTGYYSVLQAYAAEGMNNVVFRVRLRVCTPHARYLTFLRVVLIKMASAFAEGV